MVNSVHYSLSHPVAIPLKFRPAISVLPGVERFVNFAGMTGEEKHRYFLKLSYLGSRYHGWQSQDNAGTVQTLLNGALSVILKTEIKVTGAGRTDAGVHAREFFAHFDLSFALDEQKRKKLLFNLNGFLPPDIGIQAVIPVREDLHARFSAVSRTYHYIISVIKDPFMQGFAWFYPHALDLERMNRAAAQLLYVTDFASFAKNSPDTKTTLCHVTAAGWKKKGDLLVFTITADRFLRNMVRAIVGTMVDIGRGKTSLDDLIRIVVAKDRSVAGFSVPACGLYLVSVRYPGGAFSQAR
jgi:tRNA pseudouridine38-40 synthase